MGRQRGDIGNPNDPNDVMFHPDDELGIGGGEGNDNGDGGLSGGSSRDGGSSGAGGGSGTTVASNDPDAGNSNTTIQDLFDLLNQTDEGIADAINRHPEDPDKGLPPYAPNDNVPDPGWDAPDYTPPVTAPGGVFVPDAGIALTATGSVWRQIVLRRWKRSERMHSELNARAILRQHLRRT